MMVVFFGASGLTKAYRSVASYCGMPLINGASRWLDAIAPIGARPTAPTPTSSAPPVSVASARRRPVAPFVRVVGVCIGSSESKRAHRHVDGALVVRSQRARGLVRDAARETLPAT